MQGLLIYAEGGLETAAHQCAHNLSRAFTAETDFIVFQRTHKCYDTAATYVGVYFSKSTCGQRYTSVMEVGLHRNIKTQLLQWQHSST